MVSKLEGLSLDLEVTNKEKLKSVFPECFSEGTLDVDKLLSLCGEYIDNDFEKYKFEWKGKAESLRLAQKRSTGTLRPCRKESVNFDTTENLYIEGDNLEVLKLLQTAYFQKVKMIYIDPPYNTGNDFVYEDDFKDPMARYKEVTNQTTKSNPETMGRYHTNWLNMMYPRLRLASNLLRNDGVIFISIDDNEVNNLRKVCDEVFGEENFAGQITVVGNPRGRDYGGIARMHDYIICYFKSNLTKLYRIIDEDNEFKMFDALGGFELRELRNRNIKFNIDNRPNLYYPFYVEETNKDENGLYNIYLEKKDGLLEVFPTESQGIKTVWRWGKQKSYENLNINIMGKKMQDGRFMIVEKYRESKMMARSVWWDKKSNTERGTLMLKELLKGKIFDYPKPLEMLKRVIEMSTQKEDIVLDFFSGSATTAHAVMKLNAEDNGNRKYIMVQLPELTDEKSEAYKAGYKNICEIGKERIKRAGKEIFEENNNIDIGFKVFKLDTSNVIEWDDTPIENHDLTLFDERLSGMTDSIKLDRNDMDVVYEIMLKMGVSLDTKITYIEVRNKKAYVVGEFVLLICLEDGIEAEDTEEMINYSPEKIICAEQCFKDDSSLSNTHYILKDKGIEFKLI